MTLVWYLVRGAAIDEKRLEEEDANSAFDCKFLSVSSFKMDHPPLLVIENMYIFH